MLSLRRKLGFATFGTLGMLIGAAFTPAQADFAKVLEAYAIATHALRSNDFIVNSSALEDLNGVAVKGASIPQPPVMAGWSQLQSQDALYRARY